jgi:hypothetical protein
MVVRFQTPGISAEYINEKLKSMMRRNPNWMEEAKRTVCGKTPFPILIESQAAKLISMKDEFELDCSSPGLPGLTLETSKKMAYSWSGYAGIVSPFGEQLLAAGVDSNRAVHLPIKTEIRMNPNSCSVQIAMKQMKKVAPQTRSVAFHVIPFITMKPVILLSTCLSQ